jgi:hypothetical protein
MTSAFMALGNSIKTIFDKNISPMEKFQKVTLSLGYSIPKLITGYEKLKTLTNALSVATLNSKNVLEAEQKVD